MVGYIVLKEFPGLHKDIKTGDFLIEYNQFWYKYDLEKSRIINYTYITYEPEEGEFFKKVKVKYTIER